MAVLHTSLYICAERTGNWSLHLQVIQDMLPYLAASGHNLYTKCARVYLQQMLNLRNEHPNVQHHFEQGFHVIRRSDRLWAGLSPDLVIEQVLMRSLKTSGGLTQGRGMTEQQRLLWLLSMPACAEVNQAMEALTGVNLNTGEQNRDMTEARLARDWKDMLTVFTGAKSLRQGSKSAQYSHRGECPFQCQCRYCTGCWHINPEVYGWTLTCRVHFQEKKSSCHSRHEVSSKD